MKAALVFLLAAAMARAIPVEPAHPVYDFLRRMEVLGFTPSGFGGIRPWDSRDILAGLTAAQLHDGELPEWDRRRLGEFLAEFSPELRRAETPLHVEQQDFSALAGAAYFTGGYSQDSLPRAQNFAFGSFTPWVEATYKERLYVVSEATVGMERSHVPRFTETYDPQRGLPYNTNREGKNGIPQKVSTFDGFRGMAGYYDGTLLVETGQDWNIFGPGYWQHATLGARGHFWSQDSLPPSPAGGFRGDNDPGGFRRGYRFPGESPPMPQLRLGFQGRTFAYVKVVAQRDGIDQDLTASMVAHRLEWNPLPWLSVGGTEMVALAGRFPDLVYWIPLVPLKFQEHQARNRDNIGISADVELTWRGKARFYGEFFVDDYSGPPLDFWGNKFAFSLGTEWQDPLGLPSIWRAEFAQVDPWVFTHHLRDRSMQHGGALMGSVLPADSRALWTEAVFPLPRGLEASVGWLFQSRDLISRGSSPFDVHDSLDSDRAVFQAHSPELRNEGDVILAWSWRRYLRLRAGAGFLVVDRWKGGNESLATPKFAGEVLLRY